MQKIDILNSIFTRCGAECSKKTETVLTVLLPINSNCEDYFSGIIDCDLNFLDIVYDLERIFNIDKDIEEYGNRVAAEHIKIFSPISFCDCATQAKHHANNAKKNAYDEFYKFAHKVEESIANLCMILNQIN